MSNIFKSVSNSRFDILNKKEDNIKSGIKHIKSEPVIKGNNEDKRSIIKNNSFTRYEKPYTEYKEKKYISFDLNSFPELIPNKQLTNTNEDSIQESKHKISFTDILRVEKEKKEFDNYCIKENVIENEYKTNKYNDESVDPKIVFEKLASMYEKWRNEYIENWGIDEYEYHYRFPNYDYEYFDNLDALEEGDTESDISNDYYDEEQ